MKTVQLNIELSKTVSIDWKIPEGGITAQAVRDLREQINQQYPDMELGQIFTVAKIDGRLSDISWSVK